MSDVECTLGLVHCERVTDLPAGGTLVALLVIVVVGVWLYRRWR
jgi:hypothetical protein